MSKRPAPRLPDLEDDDAAFQRRMRPLVEKALPNDRKIINPDIRLNEIPDKQIFGFPAATRDGLLGAAHEIARIESARGVKKRFEYMIPERVGRALAQDAAGRGVSATTRLLEILRDAGYPVIQEDLVDLRKLPKR